MFKKSILYRRLWHVRRRNAKRIHIFSKLVLITVVLAILISYTQKNYLPYVISAARDQAIRTINITVNNSISEKYSEKIKYEELFLTGRDEDGNIISIEPNYEKQFKLSQDINIALTEELATKKYIKMPIGKIFGNTFLTQFGPQIRVNTKPKGEVQTEFKSQIIYDGEDKPIFKIIMKIDAIIEIETPILGNTINVTTSIPVEEAAISLK